MIKKLKNKLKPSLINWYRKRTLEEIFYLLGTVSFLIILFILNATMSDAHKTEYAYLLYVSSTFFLLGFGSYLLTQSLLIKNPITKYLIGPISLALGASVAHAFSGQIINTAIQAASASFTHTQTILTVFAAPLVLAITFAFLGIFLAFLLFIDFSKLTKYEFLNGVGSFLVFIRITIFISIWIFSFSLLNNYSETYSNYLEKITKWSIYHLESEEFSHCDKSEDERISYITSDIILISSKENETYNFKVAKCIYKQ